MEPKNREREIQRRRDEQRRLARRRQARKKEHNRKRTAFGIAVMLCVLLIGGIVVSAFTFLFPVKQIEVTGNSRYTTQAIITASGIQTGDSLFRVSPIAVSANIRKACPYITGVKLQRKLPNRVLITVTEDGRQLAFYTDKKFVLTTDRYEYIETTGHAGKAMVIYGVGITPNAAGQPVSFTNAQNKTDLDNVLKELDNQAITEITKIDFSNPKQIRMQYKELHTWEIGELNNLAYKLTFGQQVSKRENQTGVIDLSWLTSDNKDAFFKSGVLEDLTPKPSAEQHKEEERETETDVESKVAIAYGEQYALLDDGLKLIKLSDKADNALCVYGVTITPDEETKSVVFGFESTRDLLLQILSELKTAGITDIVAIDLDSSNRIRLQYKDLHVWKLGDPSDMAAKLRFAYSVSQQHTEVGEVDLAYMLEGEAAAFSSTERLTDISVAEEPVYEQIPLE